MLRSVEREECEASGRKYFSGKYGVYKCKHCGTEKIICRSHFKTRLTACPKGCNGTNRCTYITIKGVDDLATTHPHLVDYFVNKEEVYKFKAHSNRKVELRCPICNTHKKIQISQLAKHGYCCSHCSDKVSYPEKVVIELLKFLGMKFETQYREIHKSYRYDFYLTTLNTIIEVHGRQHYPGHRHPSWKSYEEEHENDIHKWMLAQLRLGEDLKYIVLDCRKSDLEWIRHSILDSELNDLLELSKVDWIYVAKQSETNLMSQIVDYYKETGYTTSKIAKEFGVCSTTIRNYLRKTAKLGLVEWEPEKTIVVKEIVMIVNGEVKAVAKNIPQMSEISGYSKTVVGRLANGLGCSTIPSHFTVNRTTKDKIGFYQICSKEWEQDKNSFTNPQNLKI